MAPRGNIPPYEIMRRRGSEGPASADAPAEPAASTGSRSEASPWWVGATVPVVLRLSRGMAVLIVVGLLGLLVLAYWVGASRGRSAAEARFAEQLEGNGGVGGPRGVGQISVSRQPEPGGTGGNGGSDASDDPPGPTVVETSYTERRERGLNYFRLVYTSREEGEQIAAFLAQARIDTQLVLVDNDRSCIVYAVDRGFRGDELNSDARRQHESHLRALGNQWRELGSGHSNFNTMIPERYSGPGSD